MNEALKTYLQNSDTVELDPAPLDAHLRAMADEIIPAIVEEIREAEQVAAELRYSPVTTTRRAAEA
jgi:hypothetical protein